MSIYEQKFAKTDKTDAILVVQGMKLHVNRALLSYHSKYFNTLFNSDFKEKTMEEIPIDDVTFEDFAAVLSLIQDDPIMPTRENYENLLKLADRFHLQSARRHVELFIGFIELDKMEKLKLADKYGLVQLRQHTLQFFNLRTHFKTMWKEGEKFSVETKAAIFDDFFRTYGESL